MVAEVTDANVITFIVSDPRSVGFSAIRAAHPGDDNALIVAASSTDGPGSGTVGADPITSSDLLDLVAAGDFSAMNSAQLAQLQTILSAGSVNIGQSASQAKLDSLFANFATTKATLQSNYTRPASPWEVYFGAGQAPTISILDHARNSGSGNNF